MKRIHLQLIVIFSILFLFACESASVYTKNSSPAERKPRVAKERSKPNPGKTEYMVASWYGEPFHGRQTASGEVYNMYNYTAAHKTLPFGTKLRLINELNGKEAEVIITDRGPFIKGRDIDISYRTAQTLDMVNIGVTKLKVVYLE